MNKLAKTVAIAAALAVSACASSHTGLADRAAEARRQHVHTVGSRGWTAGENRFAVPIGGDQVAGRVFLPSSYRKGQELPVVVVTGAWTTVKEQMATLYAKQLTKRGFATITFDFRGFGESGGAPRQWESAARKTQDLVEIGKFAEDLPFAKDSQVGLLALCFGASYGAAAIAEGAPYASFATVVPWYHDQETLVSVFGQAEIDRRYAAGRQALERFRNGGEVTLVPAHSTSAPASGQSEAAMTNVDYYADPARGAISEWTNTFAVMSWPEWLDLDALRIAPQVRVPTLTVSSQQAALPQNAQKFHDGVNGAKQILWLNGAHTDFYDREPQVSEAAAAVARHFEATLRIDDTAAEVSPSSKDWRLAQVQ